MTSLLGYIILGLMLWYPYNAWCLHTEGTAEPTTYILLGMVIMLWINVITNALGITIKNDR